MKVEKLRIGQFVYHNELYWGRERMKIVGLRENEAELEGDYSGGTHAVCQKSWMPINGIRLTYNKTPRYNTPTPKNKLKHRNDGNNKRNKS